MSHYLDAKRQPVARLPVVAAIGAILASAIVMPAHAQTASSGERATDGVAARVNGDPVTRHEVMGRMAGPMLKAEAERRRIVSEGKWNEEEEEAFNNLKMKLYLQALAMLTVEKAALQEADKLQVAVGEVQVDSRVDRIIQRAGGIKEFTEKYKMTQLDLRRMIRRKLRIQRARTKDSPAPLQVRPADVRQYYEAHAAELARPESFRLRVITIHKTQIDPETRTEVKREGARQLAEEVAKQAKAAPALFEKLAREHSDDERTAAKGGLVSSATGEFVALEEIAEPLRDAVKAASAGGVSDVIDSTGSFHILKVEDRREAGLAAFSEVQRRISAVLEDKLHRDAHRRWIERIVRRAHIVDGRGRPVNVEMLLRMAFEESDQNAP